MNNNNKSSHPHPFEDIPPNPDDPFSPSRQEPIDPREIKAPPNMVVNPKRYLKLGEERKRKYRASIESALNVDLDKHVNSILECFRDILECSEISDKDRFRLQQEKYQVECRAANLVKACESILGMTYQMKRKLLIRHSWLRSAPPIRPNDPTWADPIKEKLLMEKSKEKDKEKEKEEVIDEKAIELANKEREEEQKRKDLMDVEIQRLKRIRTVHPLAYKKLKGLAGLFPKIDGGL